MFMEMEVAGIFLELFFAEIVLMRLHKSKMIKRWKERLISLDEFLLLIKMATAWMKNPPST